MGKKTLDPTGQNLRCEIGFLIDILEPKKQQGFLTHYNDLDNVQTWNNFFLGKCGSWVCKLFAAHGLSDVHPVHPSMALWWSLCPLVSYAEIKIVFTLFSLHLWLHGEVVRILVAVLGKLTSVPCVHVEVFF